MADGYQKGDKVQWNWGTGTGTGTIKERFERRVERTIKGSTIVR
ncbi:MAG: HVA1 family protein, partial [Sphingomonas sp.]